MELKHWRDPSTSIHVTFHQLARSCQLNGTVCFRGQGVSAQSQPAWRGCVSEPATSRQGGVRGQKEVGSDQGLLPALKIGPFVVETLARSAGPLKGQLPCSSKPTTADDKASAAHYPADGVTEVGLSERGVVLVSTVGGWGKSSENSG